MNYRRAEGKKKAGVHYALIPDGIELPVVDVTHQAFALSVTEAEQQELVDTFLHEGRPLERLPGPLRKLLLRFFPRGSTLARGIRRAQGTFMSGIDTYLLKLGPEMLGSTFAAPIDRQIAGALPALGVRLRLQDVAYMMADVLKPAMSTASARPLHFVNIAGGPAIDSLNTLIILCKDQRRILAERQISIEVLDLDDSGPRFGEAALAALSAEGGPLRGARIAFQHIRYDWAKGTN